MKSHVSDYLKVVHAVYYDACTKCSTNASEMDLITIRSRVKAEGISFLTITLPNFCADFEKSLAQQFVDPKDFRSFKKSGPIPAFLQGMVGRIFDPETGRIDDESFTSNPDLFACTIMCIRQICLLYKKVKLECTPKRVHSAKQSFIAIERDFNLFPLPREDDDFFKVVSSVLWDNMLGDLRLSMCIPRHGPGTTAEHISGNQKYFWRRWHSRLEPYFPLIDSAYPNSIGELDFESEELKMVSIVSEDDEQPVRVVAVPKTLKNPRIIAIEPCCNQYIQQAISGALIERLESADLTRGHLNFRDQSVNQRLAMISSKDGRLATIDLSDASDRVPVGYALYLFNSNPDLKDAIEACRSTKANVDGIQTVSLRKFASMGSALCFPIEAMYFYTICVVALLRAQNLPVSHENCFLVSRDVYVYGDDILVPTVHVDTVLDHLRKYNCKVNVRKTFYSGKFRESCGVDAYGGYIVTPIYLNQPLPQNRQQVRCLISNTKAGNAFFKKGFLRTTELLLNSVERILGTLPWVPEESAYLGRNFPWPVTPLKRVNRKYQRLEIKCWVMEPVYRTDKLAGYAALQKSLSKLEGLTTLSLSRDPLHLERSALHGAVAIKRRWVPAPSAGQLLPRK